MPFYMVSFWNIPEKKMPSIYSSTLPPPRVITSSAIVNTNWLLGQILDKNQAREDLDFQEGNLEPPCYSVWKEKDRHKTTFVSCGKCDFKKS